jgi:hypothetical protein
MMGELKRLLAHAAPEIDHVLTFNPAQQLFAEQRDQLATVSIGFAR